MVRERFYNIHRKSTHFHDLSRNNFATVAPNQATYWVRESLLGNKAWRTFEKEKDFKNHLTVGLI